MYQDHPECLPWILRDAKPFTKGRIITASIALLQSAAGGVIREIIEKYHPPPLPIFMAAARDHLLLPLLRGARLPSYSRIECCLKKLLMKTDLRLWMEWNRQSRKQLYSWFNELTTQYGGPDCVFWACCIRTPMTAPMQLVMDNIDQAAYNKAVMFDGQARQKTRGFHANAQMGLTMPQTSGTTAW
jgi:hypothetical protein